MTDVVTVTETTVVVTSETTVDVITVGIQGPPGPGLSTTDQLAEGAQHRYDRHYEQAFTNQSSVTVNHNLGKRPAVTVIDSAGDEVFGDVEHVGPNELTISFGSNFTGTVICN